MFIKQCITYLQCVYFPHCIFPKIKYISPKCILWLLALFFFNPGFKHELCIALNRHVSLAFFNLEHSLILFPNLTLILRSSGPFSYRILQSRFIQLFHMRKLKLKSLHENSLKVFVIVMRYLMLDWTVIWLTLSLITGMMFARILYCKVTYLYLGWITNLSFGTLRPCE